MKKLTFLTAVILIALCLGTGSALAGSWGNIPLPSGTQDNDQLSIYSAKFICGHSLAGPQDVPAVVRGVYLTAINIHNPNPRAVELATQVVPTKLNAGDTHLTGPQPPRGPIFRTELVSGGAIEWDCQTLQNWFDEAELPFFAKGFLMIVSDGAGTRRNTPLNVVGVYSSVTLPVSPITVANPNRTLAVVEVKGRELKFTAPTADDHHEDGT